MEPKIVLDTAASVWKLVSKFLPKAKETIIPAPSAPPAIAPVTTISPSVTTVVPGFDSRDLAIIFLCVAIIAMAFAMVSMASARQP